MATQTNATPGFVNHPYVPNWWGPGEVNLNGLFAMMRPEIDTVEWTPVNYPDRVAREMTIDYDDVHPWSEFNVERIDSTFDDLFNGIHEIVWDKAIDFAMEDLDYSRMLIKSENDLVQFVQKQIMPFIRGVIKGNRETLNDLMGNPSLDKLEVPMGQGTPNVLVYMPPDRLAPQFRKPKLPVATPVPKVRHQLSGDIMFVIGDAACTAELDPSWFSDRAIYEAHGVRHIQKLGMCCKWSATKDSKATCLAFTATVLGITVFRFFLADEYDDRVLGYEHAFFAWTPPEGEMTAMKAIFVMILLSLHGDFSRLQFRDDLPTFEDLAEKMTNEAERAEELEKASAQPAEASQAAQVSQPVSQGAEASEAVDACQAVDTPQTGGASQADSGSQAGG